MKVVRSATLDSHIVAVFLLNSLHGTLLFNVVMFILMFSYKYEHIHEHTCTIDDSRWYDQCKIFEQHMSFQKKLAMSKKDR